MLQQLKANYFLIFLSIIMITFYNVKTKPFAQFSMKVKHWTTSKPTYLYIAANQYFGALGFRLPKAPFPICVS